MSPRPRRKSIDSSSSSDSSDSDSSHGHGKIKKEKKDKERKKEKKGKKDKHDGSSLFPHDPLHQSHNQYTYNQSPAFPQLNELRQAPMASPPPYGSAEGPPPSGYRIPLTTTAPFPGPDQTGVPPCHDLDGSPVFIGSALFETSVHPCKIAQHLSSLASVPYGGTEYGHNGRFDLLPFVPEQMEFVRTSGGTIPYGRRPIEGGYEENGSKLYHAVADINGVRVPGKTGEHLGGCNVPFGGAEHVIRDNYEILCWR